METQIGAIKRAPQQELRRISDDHLSRAGKGLQPRCQIWGLTHNSVLLDGRGADQVTHDRQPGRNASANGQRSTPRIPEFLRVSHDVERGAHGSLGIVFMRSWVTEDCQNAVAEKFGDESVVTANGPRAEILVSAHDFTQRFGIDHSGERGPSREIAEHDGQLASLGRIARRGRNRRITCECPDRAQQFLAWPERQPELRKICFAEARERIEIDLVALERLGILLQPKLAEQGSHIRHRGQSVKPSCIQHPGLRHHKRQLLRALQRLLLHPQVRAPRVDPVRRLERRQLRVA